MELHASSQKKTTHLEFTDQYEYMQGSLQAIIDDINTYIIQTNVNNDMHTPQLHQQVKHAKGKGKFVFKYNLLPDGVHPHDTIKQKWAHSLLQAISKNRNNDSYEPSSPKRSWKHERFF